MGIIAAVQCGVLSAQWQRHVDLVSVCVGDSLLCRDPDAGYGRHRGSEAAQMDPGSNDPGQYRHIGRAQICEFRYLYDRWYRKNVWQLEDFDPECGFSCAIGCFFLYLFAARLCDRCVLWDSETAGELWEADAVWHVFSGDLVGTDPEVQRTRRAVF